MDEMKCNVCEEVTDSKELDRYDGMCFNCQQALQEADEAVEAGDTNEADPELLKAVDSFKKRQAYMREYNARPDIAERRKQYMKGRNERIKALLKKARELGMVDKPEEGA
jgi:hypothetical protein